MCRGFEVKVRLSCLWVLPVLLFAGPVTADERLGHNGIDKVYHPYVQPLEREIEWRSIYQWADDPREDGIWRQRLGFGTSVSDRLFLEGYAIGNKTPASGFRIKEFEVEALLQLTEQGEYGADWGMLIEVNRSREKSLTEVESVLLVEKELAGRFVGTANLGLEYEFGSDVDNEFDVNFSGQLRYRLSERLEPSLELYKDEFTFATGPVLQGLERFTANRKLHWEFGVFLPLNDSTPDATVRALLEFEF